MPCVVSAPRAIGPTDCVVILSMFAAVMTLGVRRVTRVTFRISCLLVASVRIIGARVTGGFRGPSVRNASNAVCRLHSVTVKESWHFRLTDLFNGKGLSNGTIEVV